MTNHVTLGSNELLCLNCGGRQAVAMPCAIPILVAIQEAFSKLHAKCEPSPEGERLRAPGDLAEWLRSARTGTSSLTIHHVFTGRQLDRDADVPYDPADFGRCYDLLKIAPPHWRENLEEVARRYPRWRGLVDRWSECEALYEEEFPSGRAPKLYKLMQELHGGWGS